MNKQLQILISGSEASGKTSILRRLTDDSFSEEYVPTTGHNEITHTLTTDDGQSVRILFYDVGKPKYEFVTAPCIDRTEANIVVYDISDQTSVESVEETCDFIKMNNRKACIVLVGTKCDKERAVNRTDMEEFAKSRKILHFETSAKTNTNVKEMIMSVLNQIVKPR